MAIFYLEQKSQLVSKYNHCFHFALTYYFWALLEEEDCGNGGIGSLEDGMIIDNPSGDRTYGALVQYRCNDGHISDNGPYRFCKTDGRWTKKPICKEVECGSVVAPQNSNYIATAEGETLTFTCNHGYIMNGHPTATCGDDDDQWTGFPICNIVTCNKPPIPNNGQRTGNSFTYSSQLSYSCDVGYILIGSTDIVCLSTEEWSDAVPTCSIVNCGDPGTFYNGSNFGNDFTYNSTIMFQCAEGYSMSGSTEIICNSNGQWSDNFPICTYVNCGNPGFISNGTSSGNSYMFDSILTFECDEGYILLGSASIVCQSNSKWNSSIPECKLISNNISSSGSFTSGISSSNSNQITSSNESHESSLTISSASVSNFAIKTSSSIQQESSSVKLPLLSTNYDTTLSPGSSLLPVAGAVESDVSVGVVAAIAIVLVVVVIIVVLIIGGVIGFLVLRYNRKHKNSKRHSRDCIAPLTSQGNKSIIYYN